MWENRRIAIHKKNCDETVEFSNLRDNLPYKKNMHFKKGLPLLNDDKNVQKCDAREAK